MGLMAVVPTLGLYIEERFGFTGTELQAWTGWTFAAAPLTAACIGPLWGVLGDRYGRKPMVVRAGLGIGVATALMPLAPTPMTLLLLRVFQGAFAGYIAPALALGTADVDKGRQGVVIGRLQMGLALGTLVGPAIGAEIAHAFNRASVFYFTSATSVAATLMVIALAKEPSSVVREIADGSKRPRFGVTVRADLGHLLGNRVFLGLLLCIFLMRFGLHAVEPYVALWVPELGALPILERWAGPERGLAQTVAAAFIILAVTQLLLTTAWGRLADRFGPLRCLALSGVSIGTVFFLTSGVKANRELPDPPNGRRGVHGGGHDPCLHGGRPPGRDGAKIPRVLARPELPAVRVGIRARGR